jgi:hypothetical protein
MNKRKLIVRRDKTLGILIVDNATKLYFDENNIEEMIKAYETGVNRQMMRETFVNETSSRSHLIFVVMIDLPSFYNNVGKL